jgi:hypothetical protein
MHTHSGRTRIAFFAALTVLGGETAANALTQPDLKCRSTIQTKTLKLGLTAMKAIDKCLYTEFQHSTGIDCNDLDNPFIAGIGKVAYARADLIGDIDQACHAPPHALTLAEFQPGPCPSPATGAVVDDFDDVAACEADIAEGMVENVRRYILDPDFEAIKDSHKTDELERCARKIGIYATKVWNGVAYYKAKCQKLADSALPPDGDVEACTTYDSLIQSRIASFNSAIDTVCGPPSGLTTDDLYLVHSCGSDVATIKSCVVDAVVKNARGVNATSFEFAGVCPTEVKLELNSGTPVGASLGRQSNTALDMGWTGIGHRVDLHDGFVARMNLDCSDSSCSSCALSTNCEAGNCRCSNNATIECGSAPAGGPFTQDICGAGNVCRPQLGPPLPLNIGGNPVCMTNPIVSELTGTTNVGTGAWSMQLKDTPKFHIGITEAKPCPTCSGATLGASGSCSGGANNGAACVTNAIHPDFGNLSYKCQPTLATNIAGAGLKLTINLTSGSVSLPAGDPCDAPLGATMCTCGACTGDLSTPCNGDADCSGAGLGTCEKTVVGAARRPNNCNSLVCDDQGGGLGECDQSPPDRESYCDAFTRKTGEGIILCSDADGNFNGRSDDCEALDSECPSNFCGNCTIDQRKRCFVDPIDATGSGSSEGAELVGAFCVSPSSSAGINGAAGFPGPARMTSDWDITAYCPDGTTEFELGGSLCP